MGYKNQFYDARIDALFNEVNEIKKDVDIKFGSKNLLNFGGMGGIDGEKVKEMEDKWKKMGEKIREDMNSELESLKKDIYTQLKVHDHHFTTKVDQSSLEDTHEKFSVQLDKFMQQIQKRFMDKSETKKTFKMFEKQLKNIFEIIVSKFEEADLTDAMATKKPLGGVSCISC